MEPRLEGINVEIEILLIVGFYSGDVISTANYMVPIYERAIRQKYIRELIPQPNRMRDSLDKKSKAFTPCMRLKMFYNCKTSTDKI